MRKATLIGVLSLLLIVLPFLGVPEAWKTYGTSGIGVILLFLGYMLVRDRIYDESDLGNGERGNESYIETTESLFE
ncbi:MAG: hypothetical protein ACI9SY_000597 [Candidatus Paceibacteria bacterium]|jgi:hypothetical protein